MWVYYGLDLLLSKLSKAKVAESSVRGTSANKASPEAVPFSECPSEALQNSMYLYIVISIIFRLNKTDDGRNVFIISIIWLNYLHLVIEGLVTIFAIAFLQKIKKYIKIKIKLFTRKFHSFWFFLEMLFFSFKPDNNYPMSLFMEIAPIINPAPPANTCRKLPLKELLCKVSCG